MKTKEELNALKSEVEALNEKLAELSEGELKQVSGGFGVVDSYEFSTGDCFLYKRIELHVYTGPHKVYLANESVVMDRYDVISAENVFQYFGSGAFTADFYADRTMSYLGNVNTLGYQLLK